MNHKSCEASSSISKHMFPTEDKIFHFSLPPAGLPADLLGGDREPLLLHWLHRAQDDVCFLVNESWNQNKCSCWPVPMRTMRNSPQMIGSAALSPSEPSHSSRLPEPSNMKHQRRRRPLGRRGWMKTSVKDVISSSPAHDNSWRIHSNICFQGLANREIPLTFCLQASHFFWLFFSKQVLQPNQLCLD